MIPNEKLCEQIQDHSAQAIEQLYQQNLRLIYSLMHRFRVDHNEWEDVLSCAKIGLIRAAQNFRPEFDCQFSTYAVPVILGEIRKFFREVSSLHVARSVRDTFRRIVLCQEELEARLQRNVSLQEVASELGLSQEEVLFAYESHCSQASLDAPMNEEEDLCLMDTLSDTSQEDLKRDLRLALGQLDKRERLVIQLRYFEGFTQEEVAQRLFVSQVQISRIEKKVLEKLKTLI